MMFDGLAAGFGASGVAKATWPKDSVSPRLGWSPTALVTAALRAGMAAAGTDLSTRTETLWRLTFPGAITECVTVLLTPNVVSVCLWLYFEVLPAPVAATPGILAAVPAAPPAAAPPPVSDSVLFCCTIGTPGPW